MTRRPVVTYASETWSLAGKQEEMGKENIQNNAQDNTKWKIRVNQEIKRLFNRLL